jgi:hypothetical protein
MQKHAEKRLNGKEHIPPRLKLRQFKIVLFSSQGGVPKFIGYFSSIPFSSSFFLLFLFKYKQQQTYYLKYYFNKENTVYLPALRYPENPPFIKKSFQFYPFNSSHSDSDGSDPRWQLTGHHLLSKMAGELAIKQIASCMYKKNRTPTSKSNP